MAYKIVLRQDTNENWTEYNPILLSGEFGFETNTNKLKLGDGISSWAELEYYQPGATGATGTIGPTGSAGPTAGTSGTSGIDGSIGATGAAGTSGTSGTSGITGATGPSIGSIGPDGAAGTSGTSGVEGATGPSDSSSAIEYYRLTCYTYTFHQGDYMDIWNDIIYDGTIYSGMPNNSVLTFIVKVVAISQDYSVYGSWEYKGSIMRDPSMSWVYLADPTLTNGGDNLGLELSIPSFGSGFKIYATQDNDVTSDVNWTGELKIIKSW